MKNMKKILLSVLCALLFATPAFANKEPTNISDKKNPAKSIPAKSIPAKKAPAKKVAAKQTSEKGISEAELRKALINLLKKEPEIVFNVLDANGEKLIITITNASETMRASKVKTQWKKDLTIPKTYKVKSRPSLGNEKAPYTIVAYSDFLCSYCLQGAKTIEALYKADPKNIRIIFKSNPTNDVSRHASRWFYMAYKKDPKKAWRLHDAIFANQKAYAADPMTMIKIFAKNVGIDADAMEMDVAANIPEIDTVINEDVAEAQRMGFSGTPYFLINDLVVRGALPKESFDEALRLVKNHKKK